MKHLINRIAPSLASMLITAPALAIEQAPAEVPIETANPIWVAVFFLVCIGGVVWYVMATNKASKENNQQK